MALSQLPQFKKDVVPKKFVDNYNFCFGNNNVGKRLEKTTKHLEDQNKNAFTQYTNGLDKITKLFGGLSCEICSPRFTSENIHLNEDGVTINHNEVNIETFFSIIQDFLPIYQILDDIASMSLMGLCYDKLDNRNEELNRINDIQAFLAS